MVERDLDIDPDRLRLRQLATRQLTPAETGALRALMAAAFGSDEEEGPPTTTGSTRSVASISCSTWTARSSPTPRSSSARSTSGAAPLRTGYVEAVATAPNGRGWAWFDRDDRGQRPHPRTLRARRARHWTPVVLRAAGLAGLGRDRHRCGRRTATSRRPTRTASDHGPRDTDLAAARPRPRRSAATGAPATSGRPGARRRSTRRARPAQGISAGGANVDVISIRRPPSAIDAAAASRMSTTWAACSPLARCGRPSAIAAAISATPRAQAVPRYAGRTRATGSYVCAIRARLRRSHRSPGSCRAPATRRRRGIRCCRSASPGGPT